MSKINARVSGTIKALEWRCMDVTNDCGNVRTIWFAHTNFGRISITDHTPFSGVPAFSFGIGDYFVSPDFPFCDTLEAAQAAAQADYEARILAAIQPDPETVQVAFGDAQKYIDGMTVARIISDAHLTFRDQYYPSTFALGVGPIQSMLGLAIKNGLIATPSSAGTVSVEAAAKATLAEIERQFAALGVTPENMAPEMVLKRLRALAGDNP